MHADGKHVYVLPKNQAVYNYRYFLPYAPEWGTQEHCGQRLRELLEFCREAHIDAVQFYVNILQGTYYMPAHNADEQKHWAQWMRDVVAPELRASGVSYQLNFQMLLGATAHNLDMRDEYAWDFMVDHTGCETLGCACPISPSFREIMGEMLQLWASTGPDIIWIDDDFRLHNHDQSPGGLGFFCYCDRHLQEFAKYSGAAYSREALVAEVLKPGEPSRLRDQWLDFLGITMTDTAEWVRRSVQDVSPKTRLALMTSIPDVHSAEGRNWKPFLKALCGDYTPMTRPCSAVYAGTSCAMKHQTATYRTMAQSIELLDSIFGRGGVEYGPELENTRFTTWSKSVANTEFLLTLGQLLGCNQITLSISDLDGSPINDEPTNVSVLQNTKPRLQALADLSLSEWKPEGVVFINDPDSARKVYLRDGADMLDLGCARDWEDTLLQMGIPGHYLSPSAAAASKEIVVLEKYTAWSLSDSELEVLLGNSVLLDAGAADVLQERGFGEYIGVRVGPAQDYAAISEQYIDGILPGVNVARVPHRGIRWHELECTGASIASKLIDGKNRYHVGSTIYENSLGGRIAVYASIGDLSPHGVFGNHARLRWLHGVIRWLSNDRFCVLPQIPHHCLTLMRRFKDRALIAIANLGTDSLRQVSFRLGSRPGIIEILDNSGTWQRTNCVSQDSYLTISCDVPPFGWLILNLDKLTEGIY